MADIVNRNPLLSFVKLIGSAIMGDFGYSARGREVEKARAEIHSAFEQVLNRNDESDPRTRRWIAAVEAFRAAYARVYPDALRQVDEGSMSASELDTADMLDFLEADPVFFRSGYMKEKLLAELKRRELDRHEAARLQAIIIAVVRKPDRRREFLRYCRAAANVDGERFRAELEELERSDDSGVGLRANWVLAGLEGKWSALKKATRTYARRASDNAYVRVFPRISRDAAS